jgi:hypothetical protein
MLAHSSQARLTSTGHSTIQRAKVLMKFAQSVMKFEAKVEALIAEIDAKF